MTSARRDALVLAGIALLAAALRWGTAGYGLWFDEIASVRFSEVPMWQLWSGWMVREANPPLFYTLLKFGRFLAGESDLAARSVPMLVGLGSIVAAWGCAREAGGARAAWMTALLLAVSPTQIDFAQEVRPAILTLFGAMVALWGLARWFEDARRRWLAMYAAGCVVALYAHVTMVVFVALVGAALFALRPRRDFVVANVAVAIAWSWWATIAWAQLHGDRDFGYIARPDLGELWRTTAQLYSPDYVASLGVLLPVYVGAIAWLAWRDRRPIVWVLAVLAVGGPITLWAVSQWEPILLPRTLLWASGPVAVLIGVACARVRRGWAVIAALSLVSVVTLARYQPARQEEYWREAMTAIAARDPHAVVVVQGEAMAVAAERYRPKGVRMVVVPDDPGDGDTWAGGMVALGRVPSGTVFALHRAGHDPAPYLSGRGVVWDAPTGGRQPHVRVWVR